MPPMIEPMANGNNIGVRIWPRMRAIRPTLDPSCTKVCSGIKTTGGKIVARIASSSSPPAAPVTTPQKVVMKDAAASPAKSKTPTSGTPRNSDPMDEALWSGL